MAINLQSVIAAIEAKAAAADSTTPISDLYKIIIEANEVGIPMGVYDSAGVMPIDSAYVGSVFSTSAGGLYVLDSAGGSWQTADGTPPPPPPIDAMLQGTSYGYVAGGYFQPSSPSSTDVIQKYSYTSNGNSVSVGTINKKWFNNKGATSVLAGYVIGGDGDPTGGADGALDKFPFAVGTSSGLILDLSNVGRPKNQVISSNIGAFIPGTGPSGVSPLNTENLVRFAFENDTQTEVAGVLGSSSVSLGLAGGSSSSTHGYLTGGRHMPANSYITAIRRFPFATSTTTEVMGAVMVNNAAQGYATQSTTHGYQFGGSSPAIFNSNVIQKFNYSSDTNAVNIGSMAIGVMAQSTSASTTKAYSAGGMDASNAVNYNIIQSVPFATDTNSTDVGDLLTVNRAASGHQN